MLKPLPIMSGVVKYDKLLREFTIRLKTYHFIQFLSFPKLRKDNLDNDHDHGYDHDHDHNQEMDNNTMRLVQKEEYQTKKRATASAKGFFVVEKYLNSGTHNQSLYYANCQIT